jgi:hypothetical protein
MRGCGMDSTGVEFMPEQNMALCLHVLIIVNEGTDIVVLQTQDSHWRCDAVGYTSYYCDVSRMVWRLTKPGSL